MVARDRESAQAAALADYERLADRVQTRDRILGQLATAYGPGAGNEGTERIILRHHALQRMLKHIPVVIPYADRLGELFASDRVEARRAFPQLMSMVQAVMRMRRQRPPISQMFWVWSTWITDPAQRKRRALNHAWVKRWKTAAE